MFHACLVSTLLCFVYTLGCFYMFYGTNLLTRCHSASCLFSSVFGSRKAENQYSRNWTRKKPKSIFSRSNTEPRRRDRVGHQGGHTLSRREPALVVPTGSVGPLALHRPCL